MQTGLCEYIDICKYSLYFIIYDRHSFEEYVYDLFKNNGHLERGKLKKIQDIVHSLMSSTMAVYVYDRFKVSNICVPFYIKLTSVI